MNINIFTKLQKSWTEHFIKLIICIGDLRNWFKYTKIKTIYNTDYKILWLQIIGRAHTAGNRLIINCINLLTSVGCMSRSTFIPILFQHVYIFLTPVTFIWSDLVLHWYDHLYEYKHCDPPNDIPNVISREDISWEIKSFQNDASLSSLEFNSTASWCWSWTWVV